MPDNEPFTGEGHDRALVRRAETTLAAPAAALQTSAWEQTLRGKGRIKPRKAQIERGDPTVLRLTSICHQNAEQGEREGDPKPRYDACLAVEWLQRLHLNAPQETYKAMRLMRASQPNVLRGTPLVSKLAGSWTLENLAEAMGTKHKAWQVLCSQGSRHAFLEYDASKNIYGSDYHVREPETQRLEMSFSGFAQCARSWTARRVFFKGLQQAQRYGRVSHVDLEVGTANGLLPARYHTLDRLFAQVQGRRRVLLFNPSQAFQGLYPFPFHHTYDGYSMVNWEAIDRQLWPDAVNAQGLVCILAPGDLLYVPQFWFAHVQELEPATATLVFHMHQGGRLRAPDCIPLQVSRLLEERLAAAEGVSHVRRWLDLIGYEDEMELIDLATVRGYQRIVLCTEVRDEVELNLGEGAWRTLLRAMTSGRLVPTPWLNKNFREPLYLTDKPVRHEDTRTEEERQFPEFFRHKLESDGWQVPAHQSTVPIPGYNIPMNADYRKL